MNAIALLILAGIAGFLFYQLRSVLGQTPENHQKKKPNLSSTGTVNSVDMVIDHNPMDTVSVLLKTDNRFIDGTLDEKQIIIEQLNGIKKNYQNFILSEFITGVETAYTMILDSFTADKLSDIKPFIADKVYADLVRLRTNYNEKKYQYINIITQIESVLIKKVLCDDADATIIVQIKAKNINAIKDSLGNILSGSDSIKPVTDIWELKRAFSSSSPAWILTNMSA